MTTAARSASRSLAAVLDHSSGSECGVSRRVYCADELIFRQEEPADCLFFIRSGLVRVYLLAEDGRERTVQILGPGDIAGDSAFYLHSSHHAYAQAFDGPVEVYCISRAAFDALTEAQPELYRSLLRDLAKKMLEMTETIEGQTFKALRERVQMVLLRIAGTYGRVCPEGVVIEMHLTHEMIASMVGASRSRVSVCLSELQREGFYHISDQHIVLSSWAAGLVLPP